MRRRERRRKKHILKIAVKERAAAKDDGGMVGTAQVCPCKMAGARQEGIDEGPRGSSPLFGRAFAR